MKKKITNVKGVLPLLFLTATGMTFAQEIKQEENIVYNKGNFFVEKGTEVGIKGHFENEFIVDNDSVKGFYNNGQVYLYNDLTNRGVFNFTEKDNKGEVYFEAKEDGTKTKLSGGENLTQFMNVTFNAADVDLKNEISIKGSTTFERGLVIVDENNSGAITFLEGAKIEKVRDESHVVGPAEREGENELTMPIGNGSYYRPITLGASKDSKDVFTAVYKYENPLVGRPHLAKNEILTINDSEYWEVDNHSKTGLVVVELSWNDNTTSKSILDQMGEGVHIVRWDEKNKIWVDESGEINSVNKTISTVSETSAKGIFTFAIVDASYNDEIKIYNAVSPNGDGNNDYFIIENINRYPNNTVQIVNRWGAKVYDSSNYDRNGDGTENVFKGYSEGKGVIGNGKLPTGTYFYILKYEVKNGNGSETIRKSGYLHLENN